MLLFNFIVEGGPPILVANQVYFILLCSGCGLFGLATDRYRWEAIVVHSLQRSLISEPLILELFVFCASKHRDSLMVFFRLQGECRVHTFRSTGKIVFFLDLVIYLFWWERMIRIFRYWIGWALLLARVTFESNIDGCKFGFYFFVQRLVNHFHLVVSAWLEISRLEIFTGPPMVSRESTACHACWVVDWESSCICIFEAPIFLRWVQSIGLHINQAERYFEINRVTSITATNFGLGATFEAQFFKVTGWELHLVELK